MTGFPPSVDDGPTDRRGLRVLDLEGCLSRTARSRDRARRVRLGRRDHDSAGDLPHRRYRRLVPHHLGLEAAGGRGRQGGWPLRSTRAILRRERGGASCSGLCEHRRGSGPHRSARCPAARVVGSRGHPDVLGASPARLGIRPRDRYGRVRLSRPFHFRWPVASVGRRAPVSGSFGDRRSPVLTSRTRRVASRPTPTWNPMLFGSQ